MEAERVMEHPETLVFVEEEDAEELIAPPPRYSLSLANSIKQKSPLKTSKKLVPKKHSSLKSTPKQERAEEVLANVADGFPSFVKRMLPSNVTHGFWLILPKKFCNSHLPMHDATITLVNEWGKEYEANYLVERQGLSAGWRGFSLAHRLLKGDLLVFHLIKPRTLK
ncbi:hypothetical protein U1Q18_050986, partial [Sarracenia purpurea var. burkii]